MQTIWGDPDRMTRQYFERYCKNRNSKDWRDWPYFAGDGAVHAADGYFRILGRIDDVINVAGHRLGTKEIESAALTVPEVAEAAVIPVPDELKGRVPEVHASLKPGVTGDGALAQRVSKAIETEISPIARPRKVWIVPDMPKTRSGKTMRRVLAALSTGGNHGRHHDARQPGRGREDPPAGRGALIRRLGRIPCTRRVQGIQLAAASRAGLRRS